LASYEAESLNLKGWAKLAGLHRAECSARHQTQEKGKPREEDGLKRGEIMESVDLSRFLLLNPKNFFDIGKKLYIIFSPCQDFKTSCSQKILCHKN